MFLEYSAVCQLLGDFPLSVQALRRYVTFFFTRISLTIFSFKKDGNEESDRGKGGCGVFHFVY